MVHYNHTNPNTEKMKYFIVALFAMLCSVSLTAQTIKYTAFVYTDEGLANQIQTYSDQVRGGSTRGAFGDLLLEASLNAAKGIGAGYVTSVVNLGVQSIASLITRNQRLKQEWEQTVNAENTFCTQIRTISGLKDFYSTTSLASPMDPTGMKFNGIGVVRKDGEDTLFYISMHIDCSKINRIVEHSKFELVLDTLIVSPTHSNLPNSTFDTAFRWEDRQNYAMNLHLVVTSSWMNEITQIFRDEQLGEFTVNIPVKREELDSNGFLRYVRHGNDEPKYKVVGNSFVVPRSYSGYLDATGEAHPIWGTGEYQISLDIKETCSLTKAYRENWKQNRKARKKKTSKDENILNNSWQLVTSQDWDEITQSWVITVLQAPADIMSNKLIEELKLSQE